MFRTGQTIGQYTLINQLGRGGFGEVWLAEKHTKFVTTRVAVKLPHDEQVDHETIKHEATLWQQASGHPNILPIIDADEYDGQIVIVSEYAPDGSLEQLLKKNGKLEIKQAVEMTIGILNGLEFLHSRNIIHRDLKPANILLQGETPRLADFGISRAMRATMTSQSQNISGTFHYMSPEALDGKRSIQTDIWSVGVNLYQLLSGKLPFPQTEPSMLFPAIIMREFAPLPPEIPKNLQNVISKALAKLPENRYASTNEIREDLRRVLRGEAVADFIQSDSRRNYSASEIPPTQKVAPNFAQNFQDKSETVVRSAPSFGQSEKRKSSNVWMYATLALALVSATGLGVYFLANQSKQTKSNKNEGAQVSAIQPSNNFVNPGNINVEIISNTNIPTPIPNPTPDKIQLQKKMNQYISTHGGNSKEKKVFYGDLDNDGDEDAVAQYVWVSTNGQSWGTMLIVFRNNNGVFDLVASEEVADGNGGEEFKITSIKASKIYGYIENGNEERKTTQYSLKGNKLVGK